jgi:hypothetical protein
MTSRFMLTVTPDIQKVKALARERGDLPPQTTQMVYDIGHAPELFFSQGTLTITGLEVDLTVQGVKNFSLFEVGYD